MLIILTKGDPSPPAEEIKNSKNKTTSELKSIKIQKTRPSTSGRDKFFRKQGPPPAEELKISKNETVHQRKNSKFQKTRTSTN